MKPADAILEQESGIPADAWRDFDRCLHAAFARTTGGIAPYSMLAPFFDWGIHLMLDPGRRLHLWLRWWQTAHEFLRYASHHPGEDASVPDSIVFADPQDRRFRAQAWTRWPFHVTVHGFLLLQRWWQEASSGVPGVTQQHERLVRFLTRQMLDAASPSNFLFSNPEVIDRTWAEQGLNLLRGASNAGRDWQGLAGWNSGALESKFVPGKSVAVTPGKVVFRNHLIELMQYMPADASCHPEPILIVPAWIMKYYILDLSPGNSLVKFLVDSGYTVFMISWRNPDAGDAGLTMDDYREQGVCAALRAIASIVPDAKPHVAGYCLGGTLLAIALAAMAREGRDRIASTSFFAAQTDFTDAGELRLFIDEGQLAFLDDVMWSQGFLDSRQMAGAFQMLRSNDLVWSRMVRGYLMGLDEDSSDLMAWNADATRMPFRMHSEYLRRLFLDNDLAEGRFVAAGKPVALSDLQGPIFCVGTERDHVAPWRSVYKMSLLIPAQFTFVLTEGGHNAGIVSEPGHRGRHYRVGTRTPDEPHLDPDSWFAHAKAKDGSWWVEWVQWLQTHSTPSQKARAMGSAEFPVLGEAPGTYVFQR